MSRDQLCDPKSLETCFEVLETSFQVETGTNFPKICTNFPNKLLNHILVSPVSRKSP